MFLCAAVAAVGFAMALQMGQRVFVLGAAAAAVSVRAALALPAHRPAAPAAVSDTVPSADPAASPAGPAAAAVPDDQ